MAKCKRNVPLAIRISLRQGFIEFKKRAKRLAAEGLHTRIASYGARYMDVSENTLAIIRANSPASLATFAREFENFALSKVVAPFNYETADVSARITRDNFYQFIQTSEELELINKIIFSSRDVKFILLVESECALKDDTARILKKSLTEDSRLIGVNPIFADETGEYAENLGVLINCLGDARELYAGISLADDLAFKRRYFRLADWRAIIFKRDSFVDSGGLIPNLDNLAWFNLFAKMSSSGKFFTVDREAIARTRSSTELVASAALWNSLRERGKLSAGDLAGGYEKAVHEDGIRIELSNWLSELPAIGDQDNSPQAIWRRNPSPRSLSRFLSSLGREDLIKALDLCRAYPSLLPRQFRYYEKRSEEFINFGERHSDSLIAEAALAWRKSARRFRYGELRGGMSLLKDVGVYEWPLDKCPGVYDAWIELKERPLPRETGADPVIAIVTPVWNSNIEFLNKAIESVMNQTAPNWELWLVDDASSDERIRDVMREKAARDARIHNIFRTTNAHISEASNSAIRAITAPWIVFLDHDDLLASNAVAELTDIINSRPCVRAIYSDEDIIDKDDIRRTPFFRSSPRYLVYPRGHLFCYRRDLILAVGSLRSEYNGSQDHDLALRIFEATATEEIAHIPEILYHWRVHSDSSSSSISAKPYVMEATRKAQMDAIRRGGREGNIRNTAKNNLFLREYAVKRPISCSLIVVDRGVHPGRGFAESLIRLAESVDLEVFWASFENATPKNLPARTKLAKFESLPNDAKKIADLANGEILLFLASDLEPLDDCRPEQLIYLAKEFNLAAVGGMLWREGRLLFGGLYPNIDGKVFPLLKNASECEIEVYNWGQFLIDHYCVGASAECFAVKRATLAKQDLFAGSMGDFMMADFSLKMEEKGLKTLISPWGQWEKTIEPQKRVCGESKFLEKWSDIIKRHGLRNPNLKRAPGDNWTLIL